MAVAFDAFSTGTTPNLATVTTTLTTTAAGLVVVVVSGSGTTVNSVTSAHLTFTHQASHGTGSDHAEVWTAISSGALSSEVITVVNSAAGNGYAIMAIGLKGTDSTTPLDGHAGLPASAGGSFPNNPALTGISSTTGQFALFLLSGVQINTTFTPTGYTNIGTVASSGGQDIYAGYRDYGAALSSVSVSYGTNPYGGFGWDAFVFVIVAGAASVSAKPTNAMVIT